jgi:hypothetical protein
VTQTEVNPESDSFKYFAFDFSCQSPDWRGPIAAAFTVIVAGVC